MECALLGVQQRIRRVNATLERPEAPVGAGVVLVDQGARPVAANDAAQHIAARGDALRLDSSGFAALRSVDQQKLAATFAAALAGAPGQAHGINITRSSGRRDYLLYLQRMPDILETRVFTALPTFVQPKLRVCIIDPDPPLQLESPLLQQLFELTDAQAALAQRVVSGERPAEAAATLGIRATTARVHLTAIYRKTRTSSISELVRLLTLLAAAIASNRDTVRSIL